MIHSAMNACIADATNAKGFQTTLIYWMVNMKAMHFTMALFLSSVISVSFVSIDVRMQPFGSYPTHFEI